MLNPVELVKKVGGSRRGAAAVLFLGGALGGGAVLWEAVPHDAPEVQGAVAAIAVLTGVVAAVLGPRAAAKVAALVGGKKDGAS